MKNLFFSIILALGLSLISCTESTVNPIITDPRESILTKYVWVFESSSTNKTSDMKKVKFNVDKSINVLTDENTLELKNWSADFDNNILEFKSNGGIDSTSIIKLDEGVLIIRVKIDEIISDLTFKPEVITTNKVTVSGNITFDPTITDQDLTGAQVVYVWPLSYSDEKWVVYGIGSIDKNNKKFSIDVSDNFPMSLFMNNTPNIYGYFNIGYIILVWDKNLKNGQVLDMGEFDSQTQNLGALEDRAMIFINGDYKTWNVDFLEGEFNQGFNFAKGFYMNQQFVNDKWIRENVDKETLYLRVLPNSKINSFKFPNWN